MVLSSLPSTSAIHIYCGLKFGGSIGDAFLAMLGTNNGR